MDYDQLNFILALLCAIAAGVTFLIKILLDYQRSQLKTNATLRSLIVAMNEKHLRLEKTDDQLREEIEELKSLVLSQEREIKRQRKEILYLKRVIAELFPEKFKREDELNDG